MLMIQSMQKYTSITCFFLIIISTSFLYIQCGSGQSDPRRELYNKDKSCLNNNKYCGNESLSKELGKFCIAIANQKLHPENWEIFTKENNDKLLVLIKIPKLKKSVKESRLDMLKVVEAYIKKEKKYSNKKLYLALEGRLLLGALKTPSYSSDRFPVDEDKLYEFYGPKPVDKVKENIKIKSN